MDDDDRMVLLEVTLLRVIAAHPRGVLSTGSKYVVMTELDVEIWICGVL